MSIGKIFIKSLIFIVAFLAVFYVVSVVYWFEKDYSNKFYSGVIVAGESVGGRSYEEILNLFQGKADFLSEGGLALSIERKQGVKEIKVPMFFNGFTTDKVIEYFSLGNWQDSINKAYNFGREGFVLNKIREQIVAVICGKSFDFSPEIREESVESFLYNELNGSLIKASPAQFFYDKGVVSIKPEVVGEKVDMKEIINVLKKKLSSFDTHPLNFNVNPDVPSVSEKKIEPFLELAKNLVNKAKINFHYSEYSWRASGSALVSWLTIKEDGLIGIDEPKLKSYFDITIAPFISFPVKNSRFKIQDNKLVEIIPGTAGNVIDVVKNAKEIEKNIYNFNLISQNQNFVIDIPVQTTVQEPKITKDTIDKYNIKELVGSAITNFTGGSLDRQHNIEVGVSKLNGIVLAPGEEFSAVNAIGDVTEEAGFVEEYVIKENKTQKELGGGLCQIATTLFRLVLDAGLPIVERTNHHYVISYYGAGLDATIYGPHPDLRFVNDTGSYLLLQGKTENNKVILEFYGKKDGRIVKISKPKLYNWIAPPEMKYIVSEELPAGRTKCTEIPHSGVTADVIYTVVYPEGETKETKFHSVYKPWQKVCLLGVGKSNKIN